MENLTYLDPRKGMAFSAQLTSGISAGINLFILLVLSFWVIPDMNRNYNEVAQMNHALLDNAVTVRQNQIAIEHNKVLLDKNTNAMEKLLKDSEEIHKRLNIKPPEERKE